MSVPGTYMGERSEQNILKRNMAKGSKDRIRNSGLSCV